jgi:pyruvate dehydrogenase E2 component (dihydrolipoamide acetyltransferase)
MTDVVMPQMGESIVEGTLTRWLKKPGDRVERDEPLFEISTDKVDTEIPSPSEGVLSEVLVQEGATVAINAIVARIGDGAKTAEAPKEQAAPPTPAPQPEAKPATAAPAPPQRLHLSQPLRHPRKPPNPPVPKNKARSRHSFVRWRANTMSIWRV